MLQEATIRTFHASMPPLTMYSLAPVRSLAAASAASCSSTADLQKHVHSGKDDCGLHWIWPQ